MIYEYMGVSTVKQSIEGNGLEENLPLKNYIYILSSSLHLQI